MPIAHNRRRRCRSDARCDCRTDTGDKFCPQRAYIESSRYRSRHRSVRQRPRDDLLPSIRLSNIGRARGKPLSQPRLLSGAVPHESASDLVTGVRGASRNATNNPFAKVCGNSLGFYLRRRTPARVWSSGERATWITIVHVLHSVPLSAIWQDGMSLSALCCIQCIN